MGIREALFGRPSRAEEIESEYRTAVRLEQKALERIVKPLEREKEILAGITRLNGQIGEEERLSQISFSDRVKRLDEIESRIREVESQYDSRETELWLAKMNRLKQDRMESSSLFKRWMLWLYLHA